MSREFRDAGYYQTLHDTHSAFQSNNWLMQDLDLLRGRGGESLLELGCGNGLFLREAARHWTTILGVDWAESPVLRGVLEDCPNVAFERVDVTAWTPPRRFDIVASADFLEHLRPEDLPQVLARFHPAGRFHYHRIACYDDGHSHLSIFPPEHWLELFDNVAPGCYRLLSNEARKGDESKRVITIAGESAL